jgi:hypothetical protein
VGSLALYFGLCGHVLSALILKSKAGKLVDSEIPRGHAHCAVGATRIVSPLLLSLA